MREKGERREWKDGGNKRGYMKRENRGEVGKKGKKRGGTERKSQRNRGEKYTATLTRRGNTTIPFLYAI